MRCSIPVITRCSGVEIGPQETPGQSTTGNVPSINLSLSIGIPVKELLAALTSLEMSAPTPADVPTCALLPKKEEALEGSSGYKSPPALPTDGGRTWETIPQHVGPRVLLGGGADAASNAAPAGPSGVTSLVTSSQSSGFSVRVSNISKRLKPNELQQVFEEHVGPVIDVSILEDAARLTFASQKSAKKAIDEFDGGILEVSKHEEIDRIGPQMTLHPRSSTSSFLEECLGPLVMPIILSSTERVCHKNAFKVFTMAQAFLCKSFGNPLQEDGMNQIDYKGSFIEVCIDTSSELSNTRADSFGFVVDGHPVEL
eukprot:Skav231632  [mRNA]  locus=scaffold1135:112303:113452:+ [translate_table: standard]